MERAIISIDPEKMDDIEKTLKEGLSDDVRLEFAIVAYGPPDKIGGLVLKAMCNGAQSVSRT